MVAHSGYDPRRHVTPASAAPPEARNLTSYEGASELALELDDWWHSRGYPQVRHTVVTVKQRVVERDDDHGAHVFCVRSNLVRVLPPTGGNHA